MLDNTQANNSAADLLGLGCNTLSVCFRIFSVHALVLSALWRRFSKWASSSVFSADPSFSSVNCNGKRINNGLKIRSGNWQNKQTSKLSFKFFHKKNDVLLWKIRNQVKSHPNWLVPKQTCYQLVQLLTIIFGLLIISDKLLS